MGHKNNWTGGSALENGAEPAAEEQAGDGVAGSLMQGQRWVRRELSLNRVLRVSQEVGFQATTKQKGDCYPIQSLCRSGRQTDGGGAGFVKGNVDAAALLALNLLK
jgi:hypothetical protein